MRTRRQTSPTGSDQFPQSRLNGLTGIERMNTAPGRNPCCRIQMKTHARYRPILGLPCQHLGHDLGQGKVFKTNQIYNTNLSKIILEPGPLRNCRCFT